MTTATAMRKYPATQNPDGTWEIDDLEIFAECQRVDPKSGHVVNFDGDFIDTAMQKFRERASTGYFPPVHLGHNKPGQPDPPFAGFISDMRKELGPDGRTVVKARLTNIPDQVFSEIDTLRRPYRSVEIRNPANKEFSSLALLDSTVPYHKFPLTVVDKGGQTMPTLAFSEEGGWLIPFADDMPILGRNRFADGDDESNPPQDAPPPQDGGGAPEEEMPPEGGDPLDQLPPEILEAIMAEAGGDPDLLNQLAGEGPDVMTELSEIKELLMNLSQQNAAATPKPDAPPVLYNEDGTPINFSEGEGKGVPGLAAVKANIQWLKETVQDIYSFCESVGEVLYEQNKRTDVAEQMNSARARNIPEPLVKKAQKFAESGMDHDRALIANGVNMQPRTAEQLFSEFLSDDMVQFAEPEAPAAKSPAPRGAINPPPTTGAVSADAKRPNAESLAADIPAEEITQFAEAHPELAPVFASPKPGEESGADAYRAFAGLWEFGELPESTKQMYAGKEEFIADNLANTIAFSE